MPLLVAAACWPVWPWYVRRLLDRCDEPWGVIPLVAAVTYIWRRQAPPSAHWDRHLLWCAPMLILYATTFHLTPPLVSSGLAMTALTFAVSSCYLGRRFHAGLWALLILSLPAVLTFQFYAGYPLRVVVSQVAAVLLRSGGLAVEASGTALVIGDQVVAVDAPCSGVKMLWTGGVAFFVLATFRELPTRRMFTAGMASLLLVIAGNILRASSLFYLESGVIPAPEAAHAAIGIAIFTITVIGIGALVSLASRSIAASPRANSSTETPGKNSMLGRGLLAGCLLAAAAAPLWAPAPPLVVEADAFPGWPEQFEGYTLTAQPLSAQETRFAQGFPGHMGRFTGGPLAITLRWIHRPSRLLHRPEVCFKGDGYAIHHLPMHRDQQGHTWRRFSVTRDGKERIIRSRVFDEQGNSWPDISSWFWAAATGKSQGPWWAATVCE